MKSREVMREATQPKTGDAAAKPAAKKGPALTGS
jgi:hypothetical protein